MRKAAIVGSITDWNGHMKDGRIMPNYTWEETAERAALPGSLEQLVQYGVDFNKTMQYMELELEMIRMQIQRIATAPADCTLLNRRIGYRATP